MVETAGLWLLEREAVWDGGEEITIGTVHDMAAKAADASTMITKTTLARVSGVI